MFWMPSGLREWLPAIRPIAVVRVSIFMTAVPVGGMTPMGSRSGEPHDKHNQSS